MEAVELYDMGKADGWMEIEADRDGNIIEMETDIERADLPARVADAARAELPGGTIVGAEYEIVGNVRAYEVKMRHKNRAYEFVFSPEGELVESEKELARPEAPAGVVEAAMAEIEGAQFKSVEIITRNGESSYHVKLTRNGARYKFVVTPDGKVVRGVREAKAEIEIPLK